MLEALHNSPWDDVAHAYGPAGDTPQHLRNLTSGIALVRRHALEKLSGSIYHQGTLYSATARAVPFLLEIAGEPAVPDRAAVLELLSYIAESLAHADGRPQADWVDPLRRSLRDGLSVFLRLIDDPEPAVRVRAIGVVRQLRDGSRSVLSKLREAAVTDADPGVRAAAIVAAGELADPADADVNAMLADAFTRDPAPACRAAAAVVGLSRHDRSNREEVIAACLVLATSGGDELGEPPPGVDSWETAALTALRRAQVAVPDSELVKGAALPERRRRCAVEHAEALLAAAFAGGAAPASAAELSTGQRRVVEAVAAFAFPDDHTLSGNYSAALGRHGLPERDDAMQRYLGGPLPWRASAHTGNPFWKFW